MSHDEVIEFLQLLSEMEESFYEEFGEERGEQIFEKFVSITSAFFNDLLNDQSGLLDHLVSLYIEFDNTTEPLRRYAIQKEVEALMEELKEMYAEKHFYYSTMS